MRSLNRTASAVKPIKKSPIRLNALKIAFGADGGFLDRDAGRLNDGAVGLVFFLDRLDQVFALHAQPHGHGGGDEHRRINAEADTDGQRDGEEVQRRAAQEQHRQHHHLRAAVGDDGARDGRGDRVVDHFLHAGFTLLAEVFADTVENNHRLVDRVAQHRQHRRQHRQRELPLEEGEEAEDDDDVVQVGDDGGDGELPLEAHGQVNHHADDHHHQRVQAVGGQFVADLRTDEIEFAQVDQLRAGRVDAAVLAHLLALGRDGADFFHTALLDLAQRLEHHRRGLVAGDGLDDGQAHQHVVGGAETGHFGLFVAQRFQRAAYAFQIGGLGVLQLYTKAANLEGIRGTLETLGYEQPKVTGFGTAHDVLARLPVIKTIAGNQTAPVVFEALCKVEQGSVKKVSAVTAKGEQVSKDSCVDAAGAQLIDLSKFDFVGPQIGDELAANGLNALVMVIIGVMIYLAVRFEWKFAVAAIIANLHDVVIILGFFAFFQWEFSLTVLAAVLAVLGYSVNESVVIFDRIRENFRKQRKAGVQEVIDNAITSTISRTIITHGCTQMMVLSMLFLGGPTLHFFAVALTIGICFGIYSSVFVAAAVAMWLGVKREDLIKPVKEKDETDGAVV